MHFNFMKFISTVFLLSLIGMLTIAYVPITKADFVERQWVVTASHKAKGKIDLEKEARKLGNIKSKGYRHFIIEAGSGVKEKAREINGLIVEELKIYSISQVPAASGCTRRDPPAPPPEETAQVVDWGMQRVDALRAQAINDARTIKICVLDTGLSTSHTDIKHIAGRNFTTSDEGDYEDRQSHGTHTAGLVAAVNNKFGVVGASQAQLVIGKVLDDEGSGYNSWIADGIDYCTDQGVNIISMSLGGPYSSVIENSIDNALERGIDIFAAAGNDGSNNVGYPAALDGVYSIAATDRFDQRAYFSNYGKLEYACPGLDILSTVPGGYDTYSGTSMATPICAGIAALYKARNMPYQAEIIGPALYFGRGLLTAKGLLK